MEEQEQELAAQDETGIGSGGPVVSNEFLAEMKNNYVIYSFGQFMEYTDMLRARDNELSTEWLKKIKFNLLVMVIPEAAVNLLILIICVPVIAPKLQQAKLCSFDLFGACILGLS